MSNPKKRPKSKPFPWWAIGPILLVAAITLAVQLRRDKAPRESPEAVPSQASQPPLAQTTPPQGNGSPKASAEAGLAFPEPPIEVNTARMVTVELEFGENLPTIAQAVAQIERRYRPDDGQGRTFAILDAYGMPTNNNKLHLSMHLSMEKAGTGSLVFRPTGRVLWEGRIVHGTNASQFTGKNLLIFVATGDGQKTSWTIDGSSSPLSILDATVKEKGQPLRDLWPDKTEREFTYLYSACGCPVKVMVRREGERTVRTSDQPLMFPDDPAALQVIRTLMGWPGQY